MDADYKEGGMIKEDRIGMEVDDLLWQKGAAEMGNYYIYIYFNIWESLVQISL